MIVRTFSRCVCIAASAMVAAAALSVAGCSASLPWTKEAQRMKTADVAAEIRKIKGVKKVRKLRRARKPGRERRAHTTYAQRVRMRVPPRQRLAAAVPRPASGGKHVAMHFSGVPMRVVATALSRLTNANIVVARGIADEKVTFRVGGAPWRDALSAVAATQGWAVYDERGFIQVRKRTADVANADGSMSTATGAGAAQHGVDLLRFLHAAPGDVKDAAATLFSGAANRPAMSVDRRTGALMVKGAAEDMEVIALLADELDQPERQVLIETFIVEAGRDLERSLGARLGVDYFDSGGVVRVGGVIGGAGTDGERRAVDLPISAAAGGIGFLLDSDRLKVELTALEREGKTRIVSNPRVFTLNGREAVIFQGDEVPYFSVSESGTQTEFKEAGVRLAVTPMIVGNGNIILDVAVNKDTVDTRVPNPPITRRQIETSLVVADGAMVVIGGIYFDTRINAETRVPWFGRVPWLGRLFRRSQNTRDVRELLVFIAPKIVGARTVSAASSRDSRERTSLTS